MNEETKQLEAGPALDRLVAEKMGYPVRLGEDGRTFGIFVVYGDSKPHFLPIPGFSTEIDIAWRVVEFMRSKGYRFHLYEHDRKSPGDDFVGWVAGFTTRDEMKASSQGHGDNPAHPICMAFLALELELD
jgi:hypothetical protein